MNKLCRDTADFFQVGWGGILSERWADANKPKHSMVTNWAKCAPMSRQTLIAIWGRREKVWKPEWQSAGHPTGRTGPVQPVGGYPCCR